MAKTFDGKVTHWVWDGNTPLHEWTYDEKDRPKVVTDEYGLKYTESTESTTSRHGYLRKAVSARRPG
jgi:hypothetical protein